MGSVYRLIPLLLAALMLLLGAQVGASATGSPDGGGQATGRPAGCESPTVAEAARQSRAIFSGEVLESTELETEGNERTRFQAEVRVSLVYRGRINTETVEVQTLGGGRCALGELTQGERYVFFASATDPRWVARSDGGTAPATDRLVTQVEQTLNSRGRQPVAPEPEEAEFTTVGDGQVTEFSRLAAPGLAMILVGLLGLAMFGLFGRRR